MRRESRWNGHATLDRSLRALGWIAALPVLAACGDDPSGLGDITFEEGVAMCTPVGATAPWRFARVGAGTKPALAVGDGGVAHVAYLEEALPGWVRYARLTSTSAAPEPVAVSEGYFYGPIDIQLDGSAAPHILYHDHDRQDQVLAERVGAAFELRPMQNGGHDGWYNTGVFDAAGRLHTATYDPSGFGGRGVIYGVWDGTAWEVEVAAPGSFDYAGGTAIALAGDDVQLAFFDDVGRSGWVSTRDAPGSWSATEIEARGDRAEVGRFPDAAVDADGTTLHLVYLARGGTEGDVIRHAKGVPGAFAVQTIASISDFSIGMTGARDIATIDLDGSGTPNVAIQTRSRMEVLTLAGPSPQTLASFEAGSGVVFGQQTELVIDDEDRAHLVWWQSGEAPGTVCYATNG